MPRTSRKTAMLIGALVAWALGATGIAVHFAAAAGSASPATLTKAPVAPSSCPIGIASAQIDLERVAGHPQVLASGWKDIDSDEPVVRDTLDFGDGTTVIVEQKNCRIANLSVTLLSPAAVPNASGIARMAAALGAMPLWKQRYRGQDASALLAAELASASFAEHHKQGPSFTYATDALPPQSEGDEALISFMADSDSASPFRSAFTLSISAGGDGE